MVSETMVTTRLSSAALTAAVAAVLAATALLVIGQRRVYRAATPGLVEPDAQPELEPRRRCVTDPDCVVAVGDVHGDLTAFRKTLAANGVTDPSGRWIAGAATVVQLGDLIDRGPDDRRVLEYARALQAEAAAAGGEYVQLLGNHEIMNLHSHYHYAFDGSARARSKWPATAVAGPVGFGSRQARQAQLAPGTDLGDWLRRLPIVYKWRDDTVFVHAGIPSAAAARIGVDEINRETRAYWDAQRAVRANLRRPVGIEKLVWTRALSLGPEAEACPVLAEVLSELGARRLVVGHTITDTAGFPPGTVGTRCDGRLVLADVGMSRFYDDIPATGEVAFIARGQLGAAPPAEPAKGQTPCSLTDAICDDGKPRTASRM